jgi:hypothetical protein
MNRHLTVKYAAVVSALLAVACVSAVAQSGPQNKRMSAEDVRERDHQRSAEINERNHQGGRYQPYFSREASMDELNERHHPGPSHSPNPGPFPPAPGHGRHYHNRYCQWFDGHYESYERTIWVPAHYEEQYVPPVYGYRWVNGIRRVVIYQQGYYDRVWVPGYYTTTVENVWVPGRWSCGF